MSYGALAFDLAPGLCGWAYVGDRIECGAFELSPSADLGLMADDLRRIVVTLIARFAPAEVGYEAPILLHRDTLLKLRQTYGLGMALELIARDHGLPCTEIDLKRIKNLMTGDQWADKKFVVAAVQKIGVALPKTDVEGRKDAADAVGCGLVMLDARDRFAADHWLAKLHMRLL